MQNILDLNAINTERKTRKLIMTINTTILNEIWKARNSFKREQKKIQTVNIIRNIKRNLLETYYIKRITQEKFLIENTLCTIEDNHLTFNF